MEEILILFVGKYGNTDLSGEETAADVIYLCLGCENALSYGMVAEPVAHEQNVAHRTVLFCSWRYSE
jgi:hypothetical protein